MSTDFDLTALANHEFIGSVFHQFELTSTNTVARELLSNPNLHTEPWQLPLLVLCDVQTAGRGQQDRSWWSDQDGLTFSLVRRIKSEFDSLVALATAFAVSQTLDSYLKKELARIKWPNDVYVADRKIAGILIESVVLPESRAEILGIGVNLNSQMTSAPREVTDMSISLSDVVGTRIAKQQFLTDLMDELMKVLRDLKMPSRRQDIIQSCTDRSFYPLGSSISVETPRGRLLPGKFSGFGKDGQLLLDDENSIVEISSGRISQG